MKEAQAIQNMQLLIQWSALYCAIPLRLEAIIAVAGFWSIQPD